METLTANGTHSAKPSISMKTALRPATRLRPDSISTRTASRSVPSPTRASTGIRRCVWRSSAERVMARRGRYDAASMAGTRAASSVAPRPATTPFAREAELTATSVTLTRK